LFEWQKFILGFLNVRYFAKAKMNQASPIAIIIRPVEGSVLEPVRVFGVVSSSPHPACGHLLPIRCGEGIILWDVFPA